jgi:hypothetical protein
MLGGSPTKSQVLIVTFSVIGIRVHNHDIIMSIHEYQGGGARDIYSDSPPGTTVKSQGFRLGVGPGLGLTEFMTVA